MPELPEVETIRQQLEKEIIGKRVKEIEVKDPRMINVPAKEFKETLEGAKVKDIRRRAKLLIVDFDNGYSLIVHLKLTGNLIYNQKADKRTNVCFIFRGGDRLVYQDIRKLGYMKLMRTDLAKDTIHAHNFGPEVLDKDFTLEEFQKKISQKKKSKIKPLLMDQKFLAGIGNVYSQEACFRAGIKPQRLASSLSKEEIKRLYEELRKILVQALKYRGASVDEYLDIYGKKGGFEPFLQVYGRKGKPCFRCGKKIQLIKLGGRSTYFCPNCQK